jgi:hypothetical protein
METDPFSTSLTKLRGGVLHSQGYLGVGGVRSSGYNGDVVIDQLVGWST